MNCLARIRLVLVFCILSVSFPAWSAGYEDYTIIKIDLKGNVNTDAALIRALLSSKVNAKFSYRNVTRDVKDLYYLGYFSDIQVDALIVAGGLVLTYIFEEYDKIEEILFKGNDELSEGDLKEAMTLRKDSVFSQIQLQKNIETILEAYRKEGYIDATTEQMTESIEAIGYENVTTEKTTITLAGTEHAALKLSGEFSGISIYQTMVVLRKGIYVGCVAFSCGGEDFADDLITLFYALD